MCLFVTSYLYAQHTCATHIPQIILPEPEYNEQNFLTTGCEKRLD